MSHEGYDIGILYGNGLWPEFNADLLMKEEFVAVCSPTLLEKYGMATTIRDVVNYPLIHHLTQPSSSEYWLKTAGYSLKERQNLSGIYLTHFRQIKESAQHGLGLAILPHYFVIDELKNNSLVMAYAKPLISEDSYYVVYPKTKMHDINVQTLLKWLLSWENTSSSSR